VQFKLASSPSSAEQGSSTEPCTAVVCAGGLVIGYWAPALQCSTAERQRLHQAHKVSTINTSRPAGFGAAVRLAQTSNPNPAFAL
jgi:hypothetical protein